MARKSTTQDIHGTKREVLQRAVALPEEALPPVALLEGPLLAQISLTPAVPRMVPSR